MSDKKISQLTASTTPLAGTEELALVQSGDTKKVSVSNLTAGRDVGSLSNTVGGSGSDGAVYLKRADGLTVNTEAVNATDGAIDYTTAYGRQRFYNYTGLVLDIGGTDVAKGVVIPAGNLAFGTAGKGIDFSADGSAAGMTSELLDDYEEGTFTPTYTSTGTPPTVTYSHQYGKYTKIGRQVFFTVEIGTNSATAGTGVLAIGGLPFTSVNDRYSGTLSVGYADSFTTASPCGAYIGANSTITQLTHESSVTARTDMLTSFLTDGAGQNYLIISGSYMV